MERYQQYRDRVPQEMEKQRIDGIMEELKQRMLDRDDALARGEIHLLQLMMSQEDELESVRARIESGEDFYALAQAKSRLAGVTGVDIGFVDPNALTGDFMTAATALAVGEMTPVLSGRNGYYVFKRVE